IHKENGWAYTGCKKYNKKVNVVESKASLSLGKIKVTFYCEDHGVVQFASRYKLSGHTAWELMERHGMDVDEYWPGELLDLVGKKFMFNIYYSDYNVNNKNLTYRCDAVNDDPEMIRHFKEGFLEDEGFTTPASLIKSTNLNDPSLDHVLNIQTPSSGMKASGSGQSSGSKRVFIDLDDIESEVDEGGSSSKTPKLGRQTQGYAGSGRRVMLQVHGLTEMWEPIQQNMLFVHALESMVVLDEEQMEFLADNGDTVTTSAIGQDSQELTLPANFQTDDLDAFDSDCDEASSASVVLMAKLSAYDSNVLSEVLICVKTRILFIPKIALKI
ncbi:hypothetical protein Tco_1075882, partial [Tanacetum coccineum]